MTVKWHIIPLKIKKKTTQIEWFTYNFSQILVLFIDFIKSIFNHSLSFGNQPGLLTLIRKP
jgi:hypothetical protein